MKLLLILGALGVGCQTAYAATAISYFTWGTTPDLIVWETAQDETISTLPVPCGAAESTDGCTFDLNYWATHNGDIFTGGHTLAALNRLVSWPADANSELISNVLTLINPSTAQPNIPFCFDMGRYVERTAAPNVTLQVGETLVSETKPFTGDYTYLALLRAVQSGSLATPCALLSAEYITAILNQCNRACQPDGFNSTLLSVAALVYSAECYGDSTTLLAGPPTGPWETYLETLKNYNTGRVAYSNNGTCAPIVEPGYCYTGPGVKPANVTCVVPVPPCDLAFPCDGGCTEASGYWKSHRMSAQNAGKKKSVIGWDDVCDASFLNETKAGSELALEMLPFLGTGITWGAMLDTKDKGDACVVAAKEIIAAELNTNCHQSACIPAEIQSALDTATAAVTAHCTGPTTHCTAGLGLCPQTNLTDARRDLLAQATFLEGYNTGIYGPGACSVVLTAAAATEETVASIDETVDTTFGLVVAVLVMSIVIVLAVGGMVIGLVMYFDKKAEPQQMRPGSW
jgi:hypothetical protein